MSVAKTKEKFTQVFNQAKESLKILEMLEKETLAKAKTFVKLPKALDRKHLTNDKILSSLKKIGVATQSEVQELRDEVEKLRAQLAKRSST